MSIDLSARLRDAEPCGVDRCKEMSVRAGCLCAEAADEIERLRAEGKDLREHIDAIKWSADYHKSQNCMEIQNVIIKQRDEAWEEIERLRAALRDVERECGHCRPVARAALAEQEKE